MLGPAKDADSAGSGRLATVLTCSICSMRSNVLSQRNNICIITLVITFVVSRDVSVDGALF